MKIVVSLILYGAAYFVGVYVGDNFFTGWVSLALAGMVVELAHKAMGED